MITFASVLGHPSTPGFIEELPRTREAVAYARQVHDGQLRKSDSAPFIEHPLEVATLLHRAGAADDVIAVGVLHDVIEKTNVSAHELDARFGPRIAAMVLAVSEDPAIERYEPRKAALRERAANGGDGALMVLAADKVSKARELRLHPRTAKHAARRIDHYRECLRLVEHRLLGSRLVAELRHELTLLTAMSDEQALAAGHR